MKDFIKVIREINYTLDGIFIFNVVLDSIVLFLFSYLALSLFKVKPTLAFYPTAAYFIISLVFNLRKNKASIVEQSYKSLREKLRTAADNLKMSNPVVEELHEEIVHDVKNVSVSSFINTKKLYLRIALATALSLLIVVIATFNISIFDIGSAVGKTGIIGKIAGSSDPLYAQINESQDIYGKKSITKMGDKELGIQIAPVNYEVSVREEGDAEQKEFDSIFPKDVSVESSSAYEENIPKDQQELVKNYFNNIAKG